jgi:hypothetical protein
MRRLDRRNNSNNHSRRRRRRHHCRHRSNGNNSNNNIDNHVKVLAIVPRTVSPNADNAHWRGTEHGRMTSIMLVGRANQWSCVPLSVNRPLSHAFSIFFFSIISLSSSPHSIISFFFFCGSHCISTYLDHIVSHPPLPSHCLFSGLRWCCFVVSPLLYFHQSIGFFVLPLSLIVVVVAVFVVTVSRLVSQYSSQARRASLSHTCTTKLIIVYIMLRLLFFCLHVFVFFFSNSNSNHNFLTLQGRQHFNCKRVTTATSIRSDYKYN